MTTKRANAASHGVAAPNVTAGAQCPTLTRKQDNLMKNVPEATDNWNTKGELRSRRANWSNDTTRLQGAFTQAVADVIDEAHLPIDQLAPRAGMPVVLLQRKLAGTEAKGFDLEDIVRISDAVGVHPFAVFERAAVLEAEALEAA
ncbi:hypothetical protein ACFTWF_03225 [Rhodococcus sp. NPDC056960]|uniref:hypothetical protein n=1 Tax=Rhodococcus sp. NPDC056960 TaxID=3345982 RepID=UPI0036415B2B